MEKRKTKTKTTGLNEKKSANFLLTNDHIEKLQALASDGATSRSAIIRQVIDAAYKHTCNKVPTCANNHACFLPQGNHYPTQALHNTPHLSGNGD